MPFIFRKLDEVEERQEEKAKRERDEREQAKNEQRQKEENIKYRKIALSELSATTVDLYGTVSEFIYEADKHLAKAVVEFEEGAFAPFWDEVEHATTNIATYNEKIERISENITRYRIESKEILVTVPEISLPAKKLPDIRMRVVQLQTIVRKAQKKFSVLNYL